MAKTWRQKFAPLIALTLKQNEGQDEKTIRRALRDCWPEWSLGGREGHPYKAFLQEIKCQRGLIPAKRQKMPQKVTEGQIALFTEGETSE